MKICSELAGGLATMLLLVTVGAVSCADRNSLAQKQGPELDGPLSSRPQAFAQSFSLPRPSKILETPAVSPADRRSKFVEADLFKDGSDHDPLLPQQSVIDNGDQTASFSASNILGGPERLANSAYAGYRFNASGYDRGGLIRLYWADPPVYEDSSWVGLSDWDKDAWVWYPVDDQGRAVTPSLQPYLNPGGDLLLMVLLTRGPSDEARLASIRLGGSPPSAELSVDPVEGAPPLSVQLSAAGSMPGEGLAADLLYEWDPHGDGDFELSTGNTDFLDYVYQEEGEFNAQVRVTNSAMESATASRPLSLISYWRHRMRLPPGPAILLSNLLTDGEDNVYVFGTGSVNGSFAELIYKFDHHGELLWARSFQNPEGTNAVISAAALDKDGGLVMAGRWSVLGQGDNCLVQRWNSDGEVQWLKQFGTNAYDTLSDIATDGNEIYACGLTSVGANDDRALLCKLDLDGNLLWVASSDASGKDNASDLLLRSSLLTGNLVGLSTLGTLEDGGVHNAWRTDWDLNGNAEAVYELGTNAEQKQVTQGYFASAAQFSNSHFYIAGQVEIGGVIELFILKMPLTGDSEAGVRFQSASSKTLFYGLSKDSQSNFLLSGQIQVGEDNFACGLRISNDLSEMVSAWRVTPVGEFQDQQLATLPFAAGMLVAGQSRLQERADLTGMSFTLSPYSASWNALPVEDELLSWSALEAQGLVGDAAPASLIDAAGAEADGLLEYRAMP